jgi:inner membrane protein
MFWGLFTHPILDSFTTWGTQLFWPHDLRLAFQNIFVIDPLYTIPFLLFLILAMRQHRLAPARRKYNRIGLMVSTTYLAVTILLKGITYKKFAENLGDQEIAYEQIQTRPTPFNSILWTANVDAGKEYLIGEYSLFDTKPIVFRAYPKNHDLLGELAGEEKLNRLIKITEGWYTISKKGQTLFFNDLRFGLINLNPSDPKFAFSYKLLKQNNEILVEETPKFKEDAQNVLQELWVRIWGN